MAKYAVTVRRVVREDAVVEVEAESPADAREKATLEAPDSNDWECYDCEYHSDDSDVKPLEPAKTLTLYSIDIKLAATAYIKAENEEDAKRILLEEIGTAGSFGVDDIRNVVQDYRLNDPSLSTFSLSPAMTYHGTWDGEFDFDVAAKNVPPGGEV